MAYKYADAIERAARRASRETGLPVKFVAGWRTRGRREFIAIETRTEHHTAGARRSRTRSDYPSFDVVKNGRPGIPGPLAGSGIGFSGTLIIFAAGVANHAGKSRATKYTNPYAFGNEVENSGTEKWTPEQYRMAVAFDRALIDEIGALSPDDVRAHHETCSPRGRKIDPNQISMSRLRADVRAATTQTPRPAPAPAPRKKGLFGMALIANDKNTTRRTIGAGKTARIAVGRHFSLGQVKKGQTLSALLHFDVEGLFGTETATARLILGAYDPKKKPDTRIAWRYPDKTVYGIDGGNRVRTDMPLIDKVNVDARAGESLRLQFEVTNPTGHPIHVVFTGYKVLGD